MGGWKAVGNFSENSPFWYPDPSLISASSSGRRLTHYLLIQGSNECMSLLLRAGAEIATVNNSGEPSLSEGSFGFNLCEEPLWDVIIFRIILKASPPLAWQQTTREWKISSRSPEPSSLLGVVAPTKTGPSWVEKRNLKLMKTTLGNSRFQEAGETESNSHC